MLSYTIGAVNFDSTGSGVPTGGGGGKTRGRTLTRSSIFGQRAARRSPPPIVVVPPLVVNPSGSINTPDASQPAIPLEPNPATFAAAITANAGTVPPTTVLAPTMSTPPKPLLKRKGFWLAAGLAAAAGGISFLALR